MSEAAGPRPSSDEQRSAVALALALIMSSLVVGCVCGGLGGTALGWWLS